MEMEISTPTNNNFEESKDSRRSSLKVEKDLMNESIFSSSSPHSELFQNIQNQQFFDNSMDLSQISGWSEINNGNEKWEINLPTLNLNFNEDNFSNDGNNSDSEKQMLNEEKVAAEAAEEKLSIHDIFVEEACQLYNEIQNAIDELEFEEQIPCIEKLENRQKSLSKKAKLLSETVPTLFDIIYLRMQTIDRAMEQLKLRHEAESARSSSRENPHSPTFQLRKWIQSIEAQLEQFRSDIFLTNNLCDLQRLCADQQLLQLQIETEGQSLVTFAKKHLQTKSQTEGGGKKVERAQKSLTQLDQRLKLAWLRSLENLEILGSKLQKGSETPAESLSEDEEPLIKRRRTTSSSSSTTAQLYSRTSTADGFHHQLGNQQLIPSSTESECATEEDDPENIIPFTAEEYQKFSSASAQMPELLLSPDSPPAIITQKCSTSSSRQLHDVGYSSGENSIHECLNLIGGGDFDGERRMKLKLTPTKGFYKTVPLDEAGVTDTEATHLLPSSDDQEIELPGENELLLSDSMIAHPDLQSSMPLPDDYQEVMEMMDNESESFEARILQLQQKTGTQWKELKNCKKVQKSRPSKPPSSTTTESTRRNVLEDGFSCEASSEESDSGKDKSRQSLYDGVRDGVGAAGLPPLPPHQRKRRFKRAVRNSLGSPKASANSSMNAMMKNSLTNVGMDESVYIYAENPMSQSLNASFFGSKGSSFSTTSSSKRKHEKQKIHRSASDYVNLSWNIENISNSFHSFANFEPLMTSTLKRAPGMSSQRRPSVESFASTTSNSTVQETGDAHYEWDDYRDPPSLSEINMPQIIQLDDASTSSILDNTIIDEDFQTQIPFDDNSNIELTLNECQQNYFKVRRIMNDYLPSNSSAEEEKNIRKALKISAKENVKKLTAIVKAFPRNMNMDQINEVDILQKDWKAALDELTSMQDEGEEDSADPVEQMEVDEITVKSIKTQLAEMKAALKQLLISDTEKMTIADLDKFIEERKQIWDNLMTRKESLQNFAEQPGNRYNNHELSSLLAIVDQSLHTIGDSTLQLQDAMKKFNSMGNLQESLADLEGKIGGAKDGKIGAKTAEEIKFGLELCQERMDALETVCNGLTSQLGDLAALNGNRKPGKQAKYWKELNQYKNSLKHLKERFSKASIKPSSPQLRKRKTKEISTNTAAVSTTSTSTTTTTASILKKPKPPSLSRRIYQSFHDSRFLQILLGTTALLLLGVILISAFFDDTPQNNWRRMFGPQLDYVNGAPPS